MNYVDDHPEYWEEYTNLQHVKHALLRRYLGGWFPILGSWHGRIMYIDCHAGRGGHKQGQKGSPLVSLEVLLEHRQRERILQHAEVNFLFIERDAQNKAELERRVGTYSRPSNVNIAVVCEDFEKVIQEIIDDLKVRNREMAPAFVFVDPYGFKLPMRLLAQLKSFHRCELFITFMWRWVDMAIRRADQEGNLDELFGLREWRHLREVTDPNERCEAAIELIRRGLGEGYVTWVKMLAENRTVKYVLIHATNHRRGRELMKESVWAIAPEGQFAARVSDNPQQEFLIRVEPDLAPLVDWLWRRYAGSEVRYGEIEEDLIEMIFLPKHLHIVIHRLRDDGEITCSDYEGKFSFTKNPVILFPSKPDRNSK